MSTSWCHTCRIYLAKKILLKEVNQVFLYLRMSNTLTKKQKNVLYISFQFIYLILTLICTLTSLLNNLNNNIN
jgi:fucose permease